MNKFSHRRSRMRHLSAAIGVALIALAASPKTTAQTINIDRVVADLEPEIQRTMIEGRIPSRERGSEGALALSGKKALCYHHTPKFGAGRYTRYCEGLAKNC